MIGATYGTGFSSGNKVSVRAENLFLFTHSVGLGIRRLERCPPQFLAPWQIAARIKTNPRRANGDTGCDYDQQPTAVEKIDREVSQRTFFPVRFVPMTGEATR